MWNLIHCYLSGRHDYGMWCEPGTMFLRCVHCGKRSSGWAVEAKFHTTAPRIAVGAPRVAVGAPRVLVGARATAKATGRVIPFDRAAAS
jgi:hypothetical protein